MTPQHALALIVMNAIWSAAPIAIKHALVEVPPMMAGALRFGLISLTLLPWTRIHPGRMKLIFAIAITAGCLQFALLFLALGLTRAVAPLAIVFQLSVPFSTLLSIFFLHEEVRWRRWAGILLAFLGSAIIVFDPAVGHSLAAMGVAVLTAAVGAISIVLMRQLKDVGVFHLQAWIAHLSWPFLLCLSLLFEPGSVHAALNAHWAAWSGILYVAFGSSLVAHAGMFWMLQRYEVSQVAPFLLLAPPFTVILSVLILHDAVTLRLLLGAVVTLLGVGIINLRELRLPQLRLWS